LILEGFCAFTGCCNQPDTFSANLRSHSAAWLSVN
jgi:hypothetical protein